MLIALWYERFWMSDLSLSLSLFLSPSLSFAREGAREHSLHL